MARDREAPLALMGNDAPTMTKEEQEKFERQVQQIRESAAGMQVQFKLHPAAGVVEIEYRTRFDIRPISIFVGFLQFDALYVMLMQMRLQSQGISVNLSPVAPGERVN